LFYFICLFFMFRNFGEAGFAEAPGTFLLGRKEKCKYLSR
jgi:hypothetical protein